MKILMMIPIKGDDDSPNFSLFVLARKCSWLRRCVLLSSIIATLATMIIIIIMIIPIWSSKSRTRWSSPLWSWWSSWWRRGGGMILFNLLVSLISSSRFSSQSSQSLWSSITNWSHVSLISSSSFSSFAAKLSVVSFTFSILSFIAGTCVCLCHPIQ